MWTGIIGGIVGVGLVARWLWLRYEPHEEARAKEWLRQYLEEHRENELQVDSRRELKRRAYWIVRRYMHRQAVQSSKQSQSTLLSTRFLEMQVMLKHMGMSAEHQTLIAKGTYEEIAYGAIAHASSYELPALWKVMIAFDPNVGEDIISKWRSRMREAVTDGMAEEVFAGLHEIVDWLERKGVPTREDFATQLALNEYHYHLLHVYGGKYDAIPESIRKESERIQNISPRTTQERLDALMVAGNWKAIAATIKDMTNHAERNQWIGALYDANPQYFAEALCQIPSEQQPQARS